MYNVTPLFQVQQNNQPSVPFNRVTLAPAAMDYVAEALNEAKLSSGHRFTRRAEKEISQILGGGHTFLTGSCSSALEMASLAIGLEPGDEVIAPSFTYVTSVSAFCLRGARPVFVDIKPDTLTIDENKIEAVITPRTRAIVVVHYGGVPAEMGAIMRLARRHNLFVIEDAAHGFAASADGRMLGSFGDIACFSFHATKPFSCGEGGAFFTKNPELAARAEIIHNKGTDQAGFLRGEVPEYTWRDLGSSFGLGEVPAAMLLAQLEAREAILQARRARLKAYRKALKPLEDAGCLEMMRTPQGSELNGYIFYILTRDGERDALLAHMASHGVGAAFHYVPLHTSPYAVAQGITAQLPVTERQAARLCRLPLYESLSEDEQGRVINTLFDFYGVQQI